MIRPQAFDITHVAVAALVSSLPVLFLLNDAKDFESFGIVALCGLAGAVGAALSGLACRWWPGLSAPGWRLWLAAWILNPIVLLGLGYLLSEYSCFMGGRKGWACLVPSLALMAMPFTLIAPIVAVVVHRIARRAA